MNQNEIAVMYDAAQMAERREQRRYEIARECLGRLSEWPVDTAATRAMQLADALLAELERTK